MVWFQILSYNIPNSYNTISQLKNQELPLSSNSVIFSLLCGYAYGSQYYHGNTSERIEWTKR